MDRMSLRFPYHLVPSTRFVVPLGGRSVRPRPIVAVTVTGPSGSRLREALLDTGADDTLFPASVAAHIGIDLSAAPVGFGTGVGAAVVSIRYAEVALRIASPNECREWTAMVGFTSAKLRQPILGFAGFLQYFTATFRGDREEFELATNSLYAGT